MKSVLISIQPKWVEKIVNREKTIEVRKSRPKIETPFTCYIYCTYGQENENYMLGKRGKVIGEFVCDKVDEIIPDYNPVTEKFYYGYVIDITTTCLSEKEIQIIQRKNLNQAAKVNDDLNKMENKTPQDNSLGNLFSSIDEIYGDVLAEDVLGDGIYEWERL